MSRVKKEKVYKKRVTLSGNAEQVDAAIQNFGKSFPGVDVKTWAKRSRGKAVSKRSATSDDTLGLTPTSEV